MKLEDYRRERKLNYEELSVHLGMSKSTVYNICKEKINCVSLYNAHIIVTKTFGAVDYPDLLWEDCK